VKYRVMPSDTGQYFDQLRTEFQAGCGEIDIITGDVIWPAQFAANGYILDLKYKVLEGGKLPPRRSLYEDQEVLQKVPAAKLNTDAIIENSTPRPISPYYSDKSPRSRLTSPGKEGQPGRPGPSEPVSGLVLTRARKKSKKTRKTARVGTAKITPARPASWPPPITARSTMIG
jgi:hypothetical protein